MKNLFHILVASGMSIATTAGCSAGSGGGNVHEAGAADTAQAADEGADVAPDSAGDLDTGSAEAASDGGGDEMLQYVGGGGSGGGVPTW